MIDPTRFLVRRRTTPELAAREVEVIRGLLEAAFGTDKDERFTEADWVHAEGGAHFVLELDGAIAGHAAVVDRVLRVGETPVRTGYVEAVATATDHHGRGAGSALMTEVNAWIRDRYDLGALGTGRHHFYERLGWETWRGPSWVEAADGLRRTAEDDGYILVLRTPTSPPLDLKQRITCDWREGDVW